MDEVQEFCVRVLGDPELAAEAAALARSEAGADRMRTLAAAARACRELADRAVEPQQQSSAAGEGLSAAVARELAQATAKLPERQREALALRELLGLSHRELAAAMGIEATAVAPLLARARLRLRSERRGTASEPSTECESRERALRVLACRQDSEPVSSEDDAWLLEHLASCRSCEMAHAAMLEASVCYRVWPRAFAA
jgi:DNA-directed RNA polymerase specialized sigma24 family protein